MASEHQQLMIRTQLLGQQKIEGFRLFPRVVGTYRHLKGDGVIKIGIPGQADAQAWLPIKIGNLTIPLVIEIEFKIGADRQRKEQVVWETFISSLGGLYIVARNEHDTINQIITYRDLIIKKLTR